MLVAWALIKLQEIFFNFQLGIFQQLQLWPQMVHFTSDVKFTTPYKVNKICRKSDSSASYRQKIFISEPAHRKSPNTVNRNIYSEMRQQMLIHKLHSCQKIPTFCALFRNKIIYFDHKISFHPLKYIFLSFLYTCPQIFHMIVIFLMSPLTQ